MVENFTPNQEDRLDKGEYKLPEELLAWRRGSVYTVEGEILITSLKEAFRSGEIEGIRHNVEESTAYLEGLTYGVNKEDYLTKFPANYKDLSEREQKRAVRNWELEMVNLKNRFENIESSTDRPRAQYLLAAVDEELSATVSEINIYLKNPEAWNKKITEDAKKYIAAETSGIRALGIKPDMKEAEEVQDLIAERVEAERKRIEALTPHRAELIGLKGHVEARRILDELFIIRQKSSEDDDKWMNYARNPLPTPDKGHFVELFQGNISPEAEISEWGDAVNNVINVIEDVSMGKVDLGYDQNGKKINGKDFLINGFKTTGEFSLYINKLLQSAVIDGKERVDVVWMAWRYSLLTEKITHNAWGIKKDGSYNFGPAPFVGDLAVKMIHNDKKRANDYGWQGRVPTGRLDKDGQKEYYAVDLDTKEYVDSQGNRRKMTEADLQHYFKYASENRVKNKEGRDAVPIISYSGHPLTIGRFGRLKDDFERSTEAQHWKDPETGQYIDINIHDLAYNRGLSRADFNFPWSNTQLPSEGRDDPDNEIPGGAFAIWYLNHIRAIKSRSEYIRPIPDARDLTMDALVQNKRLRDLLRLKKVAPGDLVEGVPKNPIAWHLIANLVYRRAAFGGDKTLDQIKKDLPYFPKWIQTDQALRSTAKAGKVSIADAGQEAVGVSQGDILIDYYRAKLISKEEKDWINKNILGNK